MTNHTKRPIKPPFELVVEQHGATVLRICRAVVDPIDADDAWSETFLSALRAYPELPAGANLEAWLVTIAHRKAIDLTRRRAHTPVPTDRLPEMTATSSPTTSSPAGSDDLWGAVRALPERQRLAVAYHHLAGLPYAEVAELIGGRAESVRRAAADGIAALRRQYPNQRLNTSTKGRP